MLYDDLLAQLTRRRHLSFVFLDGLCDEQIAEDLLEYFGHLSLLGKRAVIFNTEDHWEIRFHKRIVTDGFNSVNEFYFGC